MLLSETVKVKWNSRNKKHYVNLGYLFTKMGDSFDARIEDLTNGCNSEVQIMCDYCGKVYTNKWEQYLRTSHSNISKDCCWDCCEKKATDAIEIKYGGRSELFFQYNDKRVSTNLQRYGCVNPFSSEAIKEKIVATNIKKYGVPYSMQDERVKQKGRETCRQKYGVDNYFELLKGKFIKENSPKWKGGAEYSRVERATFEYRQWRNAVFARDHYTCQCCGRKNGDGSTVVFHAHHIKNWKDNTEDRYLVENGITLCKECHLRFHSKYGKQNNTQAQLEDFLYSDKEIC